MWIDDFITLCEDASSAMGIREATLSKRMLNDGKRLSMIRRGKDIGARRLQNAVSWISTNWPQGFARSPLLPPPAIQLADADDIAPAGDSYETGRAAE